MLPGAHRDAKARMRTKTLPWNSPPKKTAARVPPCVAEAATSSTNQWKTGNGVTREGSGMTVPSYSGESRGSLKGGQREIVPSVSLAVIRQRTI